MEFFTDNCDQRCNRPVQNRLRYLASDVGFYFKWEEDKDGYPTRGSCSAFADLGGKWQDWKWLYKFTPRAGIDKKKRQLNDFHQKFVYCLYSKGFKEGNFTDLPQKGRVGGCPFQDLDDGSGKQVGSLMQYFSLTQYFTYQHHSGQNSDIVEKI